MPFTTSEARRMTDSIGPQVVGDKCFLAYRDMLRRWRKSVRWTTAHEIYRDIVDSQRNGNLSLDDQTALELAWQVLFIKHVWPYEQLKCTENGEVDY
jgi:hypothetical protein